MVDIIVDVFDTILNFNGNDLMIIIDNNNTLWFSGIQIAKILGYKKPDDAVRNHVSQKYKRSLKDIVNNIKETFPNAQPHAIFIQEYGLYEFLVKGDNKKSEKFREWIYEDVIPSLREKGQYIIDEKQKKKVDKLNKELKKIKSHNVKLLNNQRKIKFPHGGILYIIQPSELSNTSKQFKIGETMEMSDRIGPINTTVPDNVKVLYALQVNDPIAVELCVKGALNRYRYRDKKEYFTCPLKKIIKAYETCSNIVDDVMCEKCTVVHDKNKILKLSRYQDNLNEIDEIDEIDMDKIDVYGLIFKLNDPEEEIQEDEIQEGGNMNYYKYKYLKYITKYTELINE